MPFCKKCGTQLDDDAVFCHECSTPVPKTKRSNSSEDINHTVHRDGPIYGRVNLENLPIDHIIDDRYKIKAKLGQGGFGAVYRAYDKKMKVDKALKIIPEAVNNDRRAMQNLRQEAQTMIRLNHPKIVRVYDFHESGPVKYIEMDFIDGKSLNDLLLDFPEQRIPEKEVKELALQIAEGLAYAHKQNVIHRDIKPQNIMLNKDKKIKVMDFGIAETLRTSMSMVQNTSTTGTLMYMSPEQLMGGDVRKSSDVYSFGVTLYELLSGHPPFYRGDINDQIKNKKPDIIEGVSKEMNDFLQTCLAKKHSDRYQTFNEIIEFIEKDSTDGSQYLSIVRCPNCNTFNNRERKFCKSCGINLLTKCLNCDSDNLIDETYCRNCGENLIEFKNRKIKDLYKKVLSELSERNMNSADKLINDLNQIDEQCIEYKELQEKFSQIKVENDQINNLLYKAKITMI